ncbi:hypothetical protein ANCCEY_15386 [Ancylostoma ceylanicum]|uniref:Uncharacterized protein n=1 Tax=Ancylostoma ceylanicum TaxID=53326 RepID=A0A0D6L3Q0_9BILA|nr:hypothetical protein ANCCEY_15386 [Ancylostoma ceylanicum]
MEGTEEGEYGDQQQVKSTAQKRRDRRQRMKNMLSVMKRGRFHEIQEMQPKMGIHVMPFDLQQQRKQYRAPFKVTIRFLLVVEEDVLTLVQQRFLGASCWIRDI